MAGTVPRSQLKTVPAMCLSLVWKFPMETFPKWMSVFLKLVATPLLLVVATGTVKSLGRCSILTAMLFWKVLLALPPPVSMTHASLVHQLLQRLVADRSRIKFLSIWTRMRTANCLVWAPSVDSTSWNSKLMLLLRMIPG